MAKKGRNKKPINNVPVDKGAPKEWVVEVQAFGKGQWVPAYSHTPVTESDARFLALGLVTTTVRLRNVETGRILHSQYPR